MQWFPKRKCYKGNNKRQKCFYFFCHPLLWKQEIQATENNRVWAFYRQISENHVNHIAEQLLFRHAITDTAVSEYRPFHQTGFISNYFSTYWANLWSSNTDFTWASLAFPVQWSKGKFCWNNKSICFYYYYFKETVTLAHFWKLC